MLSISELYIEEIADNLINSHAAVMVGAGFSKNAKRVNENIKAQFLDWNQLADKFCEKLYGKENQKDTRYLNPLSLAQEVEDVFGRTALNQLLYTSVPDNEYVPGDVHIKLMQLPWKDVFTTNYDTLLERTCEFVTNRRYNVVVCKDDLIKSANTSRIIKLHRSFPSHRPFIITEEDYRKYPHDFSSFVNTVQQALLENTLCLLGFSGDDPNFLNWIGWIRDNLGKENCPKIYLISHKGESQTKIKRLQNKNIEIITLDDVWPGLNYTESLIRFLEYMNERVTKKKDIESWIDIESIYDLDKMTIRECNSILNVAHRNYPGWIVVPWDKRDTMSYIFDRLQWKIKELHKQQDNELEFIYEYVWLHDIYGRPLEKFQVNTIIDILQRNEELKDINEYTFIQLQILQYYRENNNTEEWDKLEEVLKNKKLTDDASNKFIYEKCMKFLYDLEISKLKEQLELWNLSENEYKWNLRKCGLLAEVGELHNAKDLAQKELYLIRNQILQDKRGNNHKLLSIESCLTFLVNYIQFTMNIWENSGKDRYETEIGKQNGKNFIWKEENEKYEIYLTENYIYKQAYTITSSFDLGRITKSIMAGEDKELRKSLEFLRFREATGVPFRISNSTHSQGVEGAVKRLQRYNPFLAMNMAIRSNNEKLVEYIYNRSSLLKYSQEEVDDICKNYIKILYGIIPVVKNENWFNPSNVCEFAAMVLPEALSRLCSRASLDSIDCIIELLYQIYSSGKDKIFKGLNHLMRRAILALNSQQQLERLEVFLKFPLCEIEQTSRLEYIDPINLLKRPDNLGVFSNVNYLDELIGEFKQENKRERVIGRLVGLCQIVEIPSDYKEKVENIIWDKCDGYGLPEISGYYKYALLNLPNNEERYVERKLIHYIMYELNKKSIENICNRETICLECSELARRSLIGIEQIDELIAIADKIIDTNKEEFDRKNPLDDEDRCKYQITLLLEVIGRVIMKNKVESIELTEKVKVLYSKASENGIPCALLEYVVKGVDKSNWLSKLMSVDANIVINFLNACIILQQISENERNEVKDIIDMVINAIYLNTSRYMNSYIKFLGTYIEEVGFVFDEYLEMKIMLALKGLSMYTQPEIEDTEETVINKLEIRKEAAHLGYVIYRCFNGMNRNIPMEVQCWQDICQSTEEFVEVRKEWES